MGIAGVRFLIILYLFVLPVIPQKVYGQNNSAIGFLQTLKTSDDDAVTFTDSDTCLFIIITDRNCAKCFTDLCAYTSQSAYRSYAVSNIIVTPYDLLRLMPLEARYKQEITCARRSYFNYKDKNEFAFIQQSISPQIILKEGRHIKYLSYPETMALVQNH